MSLAQIAANGVDHSLFTLNLAVGSREAKGPALT